MNSPKAFSQLVGAVKDYQGKISQAKETLKAIHTSFYEGIKPELAKLSQYTQDLQLTQMLSEAASASESDVAKYHALAGAAKFQVAKVQGVLAEQHASYRVCKTEQDVNIERWGREIGKINKQLSALQDF